LASNNFEIAMIEHEDIPEQRTCVTATYRHTIGVINTLPKTRARKKKEQLRGQALSS